MAVKASFRAPKLKKPFTICEGLVLCGPDGTRTRDPLRDRHGKLHFICFHLISFVLIINIL